MFFHLENILVILKLLESFIEYLQNREEFLNLVSKEIHDLTHAYYPVLSPILIVNHIFTFAIGKCQKVHCTDIQCLHLH
jgi:hypothetical protein